MLGKINKYLILSIFLIFFIVSCPTFVGVLYNISGKTFTGNTFFFDPWDINVYVSAISQAKIFGFGFENMYTTETFPNKVNLYPLYSLTGSVFKNIDSYLLYYFLILLSIAVFVFVVDTILQLSLFKKSQRFWFVLLLCTSGGFGWVSYQIIPSADITTTPFTFLNMLQRPHATIAVTFYLAALVSFFNFTKGNNKKYIKYSTVSLLIFSIFYPYLLLSFYTVVASFSVYLFYKNKDLSPIKVVLKIFITTSIPVGIYSLYILSGSQFESVLSPNLPPPPLPYTLLGHGVFLIGFTYQLFSKKPKNPHTSFLMIWYVVGMFLSYAPVSFSRYYFGGLYFPLLLLIFLSKESLLNLVKNIYMQKAFTWMFVFFGSLTTSVIILTRIFAVLTGNSWSYLDTGFVDVLKHLRSNSKVGSGVMVEYPNSNFVPVYTLNKVFVGHGAQTVNAKEKEKVQDKILNGTATENEVNQVSENNVEYLIVENKKFDLVTRSLSYGEIEVIFKNDDYTILKFPKIEYYTNKLQEFF